MSLLAFEAASRHLSFTAAGTELDLTQTAISHQIKNLELQLGTKLFIRRRNELQLTPAAREYLESVREAISLLSIATGRTRGEKTNDLLTISCLPTYAIKCLLPALPEFQRAHPELTVQLYTSASFDQFNRKTYDVAIRYGSGRWPAFRADLLHGEEFFPVCSPALLDEIGPGTDTERLAKLTQIRTYFYSAYQDDWPVWLEAARIASPMFVREAFFNLQLTSQQAAVDGGGIAIGRSPLVDQDINAGRLVAPFDLRVRSASSYYIVTPTDKVKLDKVQAFREWALLRLRQKTPAGAQPGAAIANENRAL